jgi:Sulfotransferase domain
MWSGPRNLSTAMMYAFAARGDCEVVDEPFYAAYLAATGLDHSMRAQTLASQPANPEAVAAGLIAPVDRPVFYARLMTHHMLGGFPRDWMSRFTHVFLIRHPARVIASYARKRERPTLRDIGFAEQAELFATLAERSGRAPIVIGSTRLRPDTLNGLSHLCDRLGLPSQSACSAGRQEPSRSMAPGLRTGLARRIARPGSTTQKARSRTSKATMGSWRRRRCPITNACG